ncbi:MAG: SDR family oxidoreductase [Bryobacterales bacterium]|nr:SDR family oxidoreductase [Bryobacterales bacterium]
MAIITGAAGGIGSAMARTFAAEGARVVVNDIAGEAGRDLAAEIRGQGGEAVFVAGDVSRAADVAGMVEQTVGRYGGIDVLVNNAIYAEGDGTIERLEEDVFDRTIAVCLKGPFLCTKAVIPAMKARGGGSIVTLSSVNALFAFGETAYTAAKGGLISMMRLVAAEYGEFGIRSNIICPGTIETKTCMDYWERFPEGFAKLRAMYPLGRIGQPREVAEMAVFLASAESSFVTGSVHVVDGGLLAGRRFEL